jgi:hypothetical protein
MLGGSGSKRHSFTLLSRLVVASVWLSGAKASAPTSFGPTHLPSEEGLQDGYWLFDRLAELCGVAPPATGSLPS